MKTIIVWLKANFGFGGSNRYDKSDNIGDRLLKLQIDNHIRLGLNLDDLIIGTNFEFEYQNKKAIQVPLTTTNSAFTNKLPATIALIDSLQLNDNLWIHDCDAYQIIPFDFPESVKDIGMVRHSVPRRNKPQGGCTYLRPSGYDIIRQLAKEIQEKKPIKEESYMPGFFARKEYVDRRSWLNYDYNMFRASNFNVKYRLAEMPVKVVHFHPEYRSTWNCFVEGENAHKVKIVPEELKQLFVKHNLTVKVER